MFPTAASDAPSWPRRGTRSDRCQMQVRSLSLGCIDDQGDKDRMAAMLGESLETSWTHTVGRTISDPPCIFGLTFTFRIFSSIFLGMKLLVAFSVYHSLPDPSCQSPVARANVQNVAGTQTDWSMFHPKTQPQPPCADSLPSLLLNVSRFASPASSLYSSDFSSKEGLSPPHPSFKTSSVIVYHEHSNSMRTCRHSFCFDNSVLLRRPPDNAATALSPPFKLDPYFHLSQASSCR
ncbi:hypothetical protein HDV57DRAFT_182661 [Trichoderma longibrachiatum]